MSFALARHGYRAAGNTNPQLTITLGPTVSPSVVKMPFFDGVFAGTLLNDTLPNTLPHVVNSTKQLIIPPTEDTPLHSKTYADTATSRCQATAMGWADYLNSKEICGVPTKPGKPIDPRVTYQAAEKNLDECSWVLAQSQSALQHKQKAQTEWSTLLQLLGFTQTSELLHQAHISTDGKSRALLFLELPQTTFDFATAVIMSFALPEATSAEILKHANWPKPKEKEDQKKWFDAAASLLGTIMSVWYPAGYVADTMSAPIAQFALDWFNNNGSKNNLLVAISHEEPLNYFRAALGLGLFYYPQPTSCMLLVKENNILKVHIVKNKVDRKGTISRKAEVESLPDVALETLQRLAAIEIQPLPDFVCRLTC